MSRGIQRFAPRCMICKRFKRPYNAIELIRSDNDGVWVRCKICGRESYRRSWAARHRAMKPSTITLPAATDNNQLGAHLRRTWDEQRAAGMVSGKWAPTLGRFVTLAEWMELQKKKGGEQLMTECTACRKTLTGGTDTFGEILLPMCQECWFTLGDDRSQALPVPYTLQIDNEEEIVKLPQYPYGGWSAVGEARP